MDKQGMNGSWVEQDLRHEVKTPMAMNKKPPLRGKGPVHQNLLSKREMESLAALCDTLLPSVDVSDTGDRALVEFYGTSASMAGTPERLGGLLSGGLQHPAIGLCRLALLLLSTWYGTFILCGRASLSPRFPYFQKLSQVEREKREEILRSWAGSSILLLRMFFKSLKNATMLDYFSQVSDKGQNPTWEALGYCGPDPNFFGQSPRSDSQSETSEPSPGVVGKEREDPCVGPLHAALLPMDGPADLITRKLLEAGFRTPTTATSSSLPAFRCDAVVIGSGCGGSVVAGVLAKTGHKVLVLEKGHYYSGAELSLLEGPTVAAMYEGQGIVATDDVSALILAGSTVGGGSTINWSASIRTPEHVRREWCDDLGLELFGGKAYDHALDAVCRRMGVQSDVKDEGFNNAILRKGCAELGYPVSSVPCNSPPDHYCGWCHLGCKDGKKKSTKETWLADLAESGNGLILPGCRAVKILHQRKSGAARSRATGVVVACGDDTFVVESEVTVVACGALNTPGLLKRSGLRNRHIGKNLHIHPVVMAWGYFPESSWPEEAKRSYEGGILTSMSTVVANFETSGYGAIIQTPALHPALFASLTSWVSAADFRERMRRFSRTAHLFALARDKGSGAVDYPRTLGYGTAGEDEENLKKGVEKMVRILAAAGAAEVGTQHCSGERAETREEGGVEALVEEVGRRRVGDGRMPLCSAHQMGSCRMAADEREGAVSPRGEAWEVEGLFVADTSVFPTALGVNPMVTVQAISYCTAHYILEVLQSRKRNNEAA